MNTYFRMVHQHLVSLLSLKVMQQSEYKPMMKIWLELKELLLEHAILSTDLLSSIFTSTYRITRLLNSALICKQNGQFL
jgi:hypothetical protein